MKSVEKIRRRILIPLSIVLFFLIVTAVFSLYFLQQKYINRIVQTHLDGMQKMMKRELDRDAKLLSSQLDFIEKDKNIQDLWFKKDRDALFAYVEPSFKHMRSEYRITHWYFIDLDGTCFLRIHRPDSHGDKIDRFTFNQVKDEGKEIYGIELGTFGIFSLRVIRPWRVNGKIVGYIELSEEIDHLTPNLKNAGFSEIYFIVKKSYLKYDSWDQGLKMMKHAGAWDLFPNFVIIDRTTKDLPSNIYKCLKRLKVNEDGGCLSSHGLEIMGGRYLMGGFAALQDAGNRNVGNIVALVDVTHEVLARKIYLGALITSGALISFLLLIGLYFFLGSIEQRIIRARDGLIVEVQERRKAEQATKQAYEKLKKAQKELVQAEKMISLGQLAAGVAHEINNPLFIISGESEILLMEKSINKETKTSLEAIIFQAERIKAITSELLGFARKKEVKFEAQSINTLVEETAVLLSYQAKMDDIEIVKNFGFALPKVFCDGNQIKEVFLNIMLNAIQASGGKSKLTINTRCEKVEINEGEAGDIFKAGQKVIIVEIKDTGPGMDEETLKKIFDPFFTTKKQNTGLGLSICYGIIEKHKGVIEVQSVVGEGTVFIIKLGAYEEGKNEA